MIISSRCLLWSDRLFACLFVQFARFMPLTSSHGYKIVDQSRIVWSEKRFVRTRQPQECHYSRISIRSSSSWSGRWSDVAIAMVEHRSMGSYDSYKNAFVSYIRIWMSFSVVSKRWRQWTTGKDFEGLRWELWNSTPHVIAIFQTLEERRSKVKETYYSRSMEYIRLLLPQTYDIFTRHFDTGRARSKR